MQQYRNIVTVVLEQPGGKIWIKGPYIIAFKGKFIKISPFIFFYYFREVKVICWTKKKEEKVLK